MFLGLISFRGKIGRIGWLVHLIAGGIAAAGVLMIAFELIETSPRPPIPVQDRIMYAAIAVWALIALSFLGATIRRLRDAGSPLPLIELIAALAVPLFGWLWLLYRLLIADRAGTKADAQESAQQEQQVPARPADQKAPRKRQERTETRAHQGHVHEFKTQLPAGNRGKDTPVVQRRTGATVTRMRNRLAPRARRTVGF